MYLSFYKLAKKPFKISSDPQFLWTGEKHQEALANLRYGLLEANGYVVLTGDIGTGKTTLVNALVDSLDDNVLLANINHTTLDTLDFLKLVANAYDDSVEIHTKADFLLFFQAFLKKSYEQGKFVLLIIDEAHRLSEELLEEIRLLSNFEQHGLQSVNIFFVGQNELKEKLMQHACRALRQRITLFYDLAPLSASETQEYISHRLKVAGTTKPLFTKQAIDEVHAFTRGYPRLINILCDRAMLTGFVDEKREITVGHVQECIEEINLFDSAFVGAKDLSAAEDSGAVKPPDAAVEEQPHEGRKAHEVQEEAKVEEQRPAVEVTEGGERRIGRKLGGDNRRVVFPLGVSVLGIVVLSAVGIGLYTMLPLHAERGQDINGKPVVDREKPPLVHEGEQTNEVSLKGGEGVEEGGVLHASALQSSASSTVAEKQEEREAAGAQKPQSSADDAAAEEGTVSAPPPPAESDVAAADQASAESPTLQPELPQVTDEGLAKVAIEQGDFQRAIELLASYQESAEAESEDLLPLYAQALVGRAQQVAKTSPEQAIGLLEKAIEADNGNTAAFFHLGRLQAGEKQYAKAIEAYQNATLSDATFPDAFFNLGLLYAASGMYAEAEVQFQQVVALKPPYADKAYFNLAVMQQKLNKPEESVKNLHLALELRPDNQKVRKYLDQLLAQGGNGEQ